MLILKRCTLPIRFLLNRLKLVGAMSTHYKRRNSSSRNNYDCPDKKPKLEELDSPVLAQTGGSHSFGSRRALPVLPGGYLQESINYHHAGAYANVIQSALLNAQVDYRKAYKMHQRVVNPFYKPPAVVNRRHLSSTAVAHQQLSNVSFNRNENCGGRGKKNSGYTTNIEEKLGKGTRKWVPTQLGTALEKIDGGRKPGFSFTLMNYNVLAQDLLDQHPEIYKQHSRNTLTWPHRWSRLLADFKKHSSDILCLQEVQQEHLNDYFMKHLSALGKYSVFRNGVMLVMWKEKDHNSQIEIHRGYTAIYKQRTGTYPDGCAIFFKHDILKLLEHTTIDFHQPNSNLLDRDNVGIVAKFAPIQQETAEFIVATTHLLYNPKRDDVRVAQIQLFLTEIERMSYKKNSVYLPIIMTGDFNSVPDSYVVQFIKNGNLNYGTMPRRPASIQKNNSHNKWIPSALGITDNCQHIELLSRRLQNVNLSREQEVDTIQIQHPQKTKFTQNNNASNEHFNTGMLKHNFVFKSVYSNFAKSQMEATTHQDAWITVDYMFYSSKMGPTQNAKKDDKLVLLAKYTLPLGNQLTGVTIPNRELGSDHFALLAKFKLDF